MWCVVLGVAAVVVSVVGYFFYIDAALTTIMALLIGVFDHLTIEKVRHYPRPITERTVTATNPKPPHLLVALGTNEATPAKDLSPNSRVVSIARADAENHKPQRQIKLKRFAHLHQPKWLARQRQNYEGYGYAIALGYSEGYHPGR